MNPTESHSYFLLNREKISNQQRRGVKRACPVFRGLVSFSEPKKNFSDCRTPLKFLIKRNANLVLDENFENSYFGID